MQTQIIDIRTVTQSDGITQRVLIDYEELHEDGENVYQTSQITFDKDTPFFEIMIQVDDIEMTDQDCRRLAAAVMNAQAALPLHVID